MGGFLCAFSFKMETILTLELSRGDHSILYTRSYIFQIFLK